MLWSRSSCIAANTKPCFASYCMVISDKFCVRSDTSSSGNGVNLLPSLGSILNLHNLVCLSRQPRYRVSPSSSISAPCLSSHKVHPASTISAPDIMLWGRCGTVNPILAGSGSLFILFFFVLVVLMGTLDGVSNFLFGSCTSASSTAASSP